MNNLLPNRVIVGSAIVGIVGAAGMFLYEHLYAEKRRAMLVSEMAKLDKQVASMRSELEALRELQKESNQRRQKPKRRVKRENATTAKPTASGDKIDAPEVSYTSDSEYFTDYQSVTGTDVEFDNDEFYDVNTDEDDDTLHETLPNGNSNSLDDDMSDKLDSLSFSPKKVT